jgi:hypothetical protein
MPLQARDEVVTYTRELAEKGQLFAIFANIHACNEGFNLQVSCVDLVVYVTNFTSRLQHISNVIIASQDWNPAAEE